MRSTSRFELAVAKERPGASDVVVLEALDEVRRGLLALDTWVDLVVADPQGSGTESGCGTDLLLLERFSNSPAKSKIILRR